MVGALAIGVLAPACLSCGPRGHRPRASLLAPPSRLTGPAAPGYDEIAPAMDAVFGWVNAHGGVYGRKIKYTYLRRPVQPGRNGDTNSKARAAGQRLRRRRVARDPDTGGRAVVPQFAGRPSAFHRVGVQLLERSRSTPTASAGNPPTRSRARSSVRTSRRISAARRSGTCPRTTSSGRTSSRA